MITATETRISLQGGCDFDSCAQFAMPLHEQLSHGYERCSVLEVPDSLAEWRDAHRTARKRADRCARLGYQFSEIRRELYLDDIHDINVSLTERQGRPMTQSYRERQTFLPLQEYRCDLHAIRTYGVLLDEKLVAYLWLYRAGDLALVSSILGHGEHLANDVMYLLFENVLFEQIKHGGFFVYNRHDSGTDGLRYFKERLGFEATEVAWLL